MTYVISESCVDLMDRSCVQDCPADCIYEGERMLYINPNECVDCGACEDACPNGAAMFQLDIPGEFAQYTRIAAEWVAGNDATGGASKRGVVGVDHPSVAALPFPTARLRECND
jgi:ferredoxin